MPYGCILWQATESLSIFRDSLTPSTYSEPINVYHVAIAQQPDMQQEDLIKRQQDILAKNKSLLKRCNTRMVGVLFAQVNGGTKALAP